MTVISIHALREEGDRASSRTCRSSSISIHALREEGDFCVYRTEATGKQFLSTPSARRATFTNAPTNIPIRISIHALREEGDLIKANGAVKSCRISIHALREEGDLSHHYHHHFPS